MPGVVKMVNAAKLDFIRGVHTPADTYKMALYSSTIGLNEAAGEYTTANEVVGMGYEAGGKILLGYQALQDQDAAIITFADPIWMNSTISARGALVYNATQGNRALVFINFGELFTSSNGPFRVQLPPATKATGFIRLR